MTYPEVLANARECIGKYCKACPVCNGVACKNQIPGPGAKGVGDTAIRNYNKWAEIRVNMDTLCEGGTPDTHIELFGKSFKYPFFAGPVGAVNLHYSEAYTDMTYNDGPFRPDDHYPQEHGGNHCRPARSGLGLQDHGGRCGAHAGICREDRRGLVRQGCQAQRGHRQGIFRGAVKA